MVARSVQASDPAILEDLASVRLGTATFRRALNQVADGDFDAPSLLPGWQRRHVAAHLGYNARAIARLVTWAATGVETPMYASPRARAEEIERGASLRPDALRSLCEHAAVDLDVRWRDLPDPAWTSTVVTAQGRTVPVSETLWMRSREVWLHAIDLDVGLRVAEIPAAVLARLLTDIIGAWGKRGDLEGWAITVELPGAEVKTFGSERDASDVVRGPLSAVVAWASGREADVAPGQLTWLKGDPKPAPRWL